MYEVDEISGSGDPAVCRNPTILRASRKGQKSQDNKDAKCSSLQPQEKNGRDDMSEDVERSKARDFVDKIRLKRSGGSDAERREIIRKLPDIGPSLLEGYDEARRDLGSAVILLSQDLNTKPTHFVYELIQNADDNKYGQSEEAPFLHFVVTPQCITIESNEDGFSYENVEALCSVGKSTKKGRSGYIGEKGIGFKSVFKVARRVTIQSGPFYFYIDHDENSVPPGMDMVTPHNVLPDRQSKLPKLPAEVRTRIVLDLRDWCDMEQFKSLTTVLLFLQKLKKLSIRLEPAGSRVDEMQYSLKRGKEKAEITIVHNRDESKRRFILTTQTINDMPSHNKRPSKQHADVLLAFPVDNDDMPVEKSEYIYAFLPLFKIGFPFLIQSDFITSANRENIEDSEWNRRLLQGITELFMQTAEEFANHPKLKYAWVRFIPVDPVADEFWGNLQQMLLDRLRNAEVFRTLSGSLRMPSALRKVPVEYCDADEQPLLPDLVRSSLTAYMSDGYHSVYEWPKLSALGARVLSASGFISRLKAMLNDTRSRMDTETANSDWHVRVADALLALKGNRDLWDKIERLPLIPLSKGWRAASKHASIYFPQCGGIDVPRDLGAFNTIQQAAFDVAERRRLFKQLGAEECDPVAVSDHIELVYANNLEWNWDQHIGHIKFLYWHHARLLAADKHVKLKIAYFEDDELKSSFPHSSNKWIYDEMEDGTQAGGLLADEEVTRCLANDVIMFSSRYHEALEDIELRHGSEAIDWLHRLFDVRESIEIHQRGSDFSKARASREFIVLAEKYPEHLLDMLEPHSADLVLHKRWEPIISRMSVPILHSDLLRPLNTTFIPRPKLLESVMALNLEKDFGFIEELAGEDDSGWSNWSFLKKFGVKSRMDLQFWLHVLRHASEQNKSETDFNKIFAGMQRFVDDEAETIKSALNADPLIPWRSSRYLLKDCIWADDDTQIPGKASIASDFPEREGLFVDYLGVPLPSLKMHVDALVQRSASSSFTKEEALRLMQNLCTFQPDKAAVQALIRCPIFPVRMPSSQIQWMDSVGEFCIFDRIQHRRIIGNQVNHLDFTIEELHEIEPLLTVFELQSRFSSWVVAESTAVEGSTHERRLTIDLRSKAYAICRLAAHGHSHRCYSREGIQRTFEILRGVEGHQSNNITKVYKIQDAEEKWLSIPANKADCHVEEAEILKVYISSDARRHHVCITNELPRRLLMRLGVVKDDLVIKLGAVLSARSLDDVDELLEQYGIISPDGISRPDQDELDSAQQSYDSASLLSPGSESTPFTRNTTPAATSSTRKLDSSRVSSNSVPRSSPFSIDDQQRTPETSPSPSMAARSSVPDGAPIRPFTFTPPTATDDIARQYKRLLDFVVSAGRQSGLSTLPRAGATSRCSIDPPNGLVTNRAVLASNRPERDLTKIGAVGELLVFEILRGLNLKFFSLNNWQSKIRGCVSAHEDYNDLGNWPDFVETSDIVFDDTYFDLYKILRDLGYFEEGELPKKAYRFQIEVKTTASRLETEFFMSEKQVELMNNTAPTIFSLEKIFIIARVFNLGRADMGLKLYVDPAKLRRDGELIFESSSYKVRPGR